jgi:hypothetical protein
MEKPRVILALLTLLITACGDTTEPIVPTTLELSELALNLERFDTVRVTATLLDQHGSPFAAMPIGFEVTWSSSAPQVAEVDNGTVVAVSPGSATITARAGNLPPANLPVQVSRRTYQGQLSFEYSGHRSGSFVVSSSFQFLPSGDPNAANVAFTNFNTEWEDQDIFAMRERDDGLSDVLWFWVDQAVSTTGTRPVSDGMLFLGASPDAHEDLYWVSSGTVEFTAATARRLAGTFTMSLEHEQLDATLSVTDGAFDLPVVPEAELEGTGETGAATNFSVSSWTVIPGHIYRAVAEARAARRLGSAVP